MLKSWIETLIKNFIKNNITEENIASVVASVLNNLKSKVEATETKVDDYTWYVASKLLTDPVIIHELYLLIQSGINEEREVLNEQSGECVDCVV